MFVSRSIPFTDAVFVLAACSAATPPSSFSNAVRTSSGIAATGSAGPQGGAGGTPSGAGAITATRVQ